MELYDSLLSFQNNVTEFLLIPYPSKQDEWMSLSFTYFLVVDILSFPFSSFQFPIYTPYHPNWSVVVTNRMVGHYQGYSAMITT